MTLSLASLKVHHLARRGVELIVRVRPGQHHVFDNVNFTPIALPTTNRSAATIFQATAGYTDASDTFDSGGRLGQLVVRVNW